jgi:Short C-terminal domain/Domain of unknown function (DUF4429)
MIMLLRRKKETPSSPPPAAPANLNMDQVLLEAKGVNGQLQLLPAKLRIKRGGLMALATQGIKGDKEIYIDQISSIQLKRAGMANGYIQFSFLGGQETKSGIMDATHDENTVMFTKRHQPAFEAIKQAVEQQLHQARTSGMQQPMQQATPQDIPEQIQKLSALKDRGILTEAEFQQKKQDLLSKM